MSSKATMIIVGDNDDVEHSVMFNINKRGGEVTLDCTDMDGDDTEAVTNNDHDNLIKVDRDDSGVYVCAVRDNGYKERVVRHLSEHAPLVETGNSIEHVTHVYQHPGYPVIMMCHVSAAPVPVIHWYKLGDDGEVKRVVSDDDTDIVISGYSDGVISSSLIILSVDHHHYGQYLCEAKNTVGVTNSSLSLQFSDHPVLYSENSSSKLWTVSPLTMTMIMLLSRIMNHVQL